MGSGTGPSPRLQNAGTEGLGKRRSAKRGGGYVEVSLDEEETATRDWRVAKTWLFREVGRIKDSS